MSLFLRPDLDAQPTDGNRYIELMRFLIQKGAGGSAFCVSTIGGKEYV